MSLVEGSKEMKRRFNQVEREESSAMPTSHCYYFVAQAAAWHTNLHFLN